MKLVLVTDTTQRLAQDILDEIHLRYRDPHHMIRAIEDLAKAALRAEAEVAAAPKTGEPLVGATAEMTVLDEGPDPVATVKAAVGRGRSKGKADT